MLIKNLSTRFYLFIFFTLNGLFIFSISQAQEILSPEVFIQQVKSFHPVAKQADLLLDRADANLLAAKGGFDPFIEWNQDRKTFDGLRYYDYRDAMFSLPTASPFSIRSGMENVSGEYTQPELTGGRSSYIGVEMKLLKGFLIDKQRASLQTARVFKLQTKKDQENIINDLMIDAYEAYVQWSAAYRLSSLYSKYLSNAEERMNFVRIAYRHGDRSAADTVEAFGQLQNYKMLENDANIMLNARRFELSVFLWNQQEAPYVLSESYLPDTTSLSNPIVPRDVSGHPMLASYRYKLDMLEIERKLKFQNLLPSINVKANLLSKEYYEKLSVSNSYFNNNYKFGISIQSPLFLRQGRGEYRESKLKILEGQLQLSQKAWELQTKLDKYQNETRLYQQQILAAYEVKSSYQTLYKTEQFKFTQGESSLFLVNAREIKLLEIDQKIIDLQMKQSKAYYRTLWSAGILR